MEANKDTIASNEMNPQTMDSETQQKHSGAKPKVKTLDLNSAQMNFKNGPNILGTTPTSPPEQLKTPNGEVQNTNTFPAFIAGKRQYMSVRQQSVTEHAQSKQEQCVLDIGSHLPPPGSNPQPEPAPTPTPSQSAVRNGLANSGYSVSDSNSQCSRHRHNHQQQQPHNQQPSSNSNRSREQCACGLQNSNHHHHHQQTAPQTVYNPYSNGRSVSETFISIPDSDTSLQKKYSCCVKVSIPFLLFIMVALLAGLSVFLWLQTQQTSNQGMCVACASIHENYTSLFERQNTFCCARNSKENQLLIEALAQKQAEEQNRGRGGGANSGSSWDFQYRPYPNSGAGSNPATVYRPNDTNIFVAVLHLDERATAALPVSAPASFDDSLPVDERIEVHLNTWEKDQDTSATGVGFVYIPSDQQQNLIAKIQITKTADYKIESRMGVRGNQDGVAEYVMFSQMLRRLKEVDEDRTRGEQVLSDRKLMHCPAEIETNMGCDSSLMTGVLPLHEGDVIYVEVSHPHLIVANSNTYFAIYRI